MKTRHAQQYAYGFGYGFAFVRMFRWAYRLVTRLLGGR